MSKVNNFLPIVVDLDKTLIETDMLYESIVEYIRNNPIRIFSILSWITEGKGAFKRKLAEKVQPEIETIPINLPFVKFLKQKKQKGHPIYLATATDEILARKVANRFNGLFDDVMGSNGTINLKGPNKAVFLKKRFPDGFIYAGDSKADLKVWKDASGIITVNMSNKTLAKARCINEPIAIFEPKYLTFIKPFLRVLRLHQWSKNALLFVPLILGFSYLNTSDVLNAITGFILISIAASATYIINDLTDLSADRKHPNKYRRPFASGELSLLCGLISAPILITLCLILAFFLSPVFFLILFSYTCLTLSYSFYLKTIILLDTFIIGILFTLRVLMGFALTELPFSGWLVSFSTFFFLALALAKRHAEIVRFAKKKKGPIPGRGYLSSDSPVTLSLGIASSLASIVILMLYMTQEVFVQAPYDNPDLLWACPILIFLWIQRIWLYSHRGELNDDPVIFAFKDKISLLLGILTLLIIGLAL